MALTKLVDGVEVTMTSAEEAAIRAEWATWVTPRLPTRSEIASAELVRSPALTGLIREIAIRLGITEQDLINGTTTRA